MTELFKSIEYLKGVGKARGEKYRKLGIETPYDLLYYIPRKYLDYRCYVPVEQAVLNENNVLKLTVTRKLAPQRVRGGMMIYKAAATDGVSDILIVIYNNFYGFNALKEGCCYYMYGKVTGNFLRREISAPQFISADENVLIQPIYHLTTGLSVNMIRANIKQAVQLMLEEPFETLPHEIMNRYDLCGLSYAISNIHFPISNEAAESARNRLAFDELLTLQLGMSMMKTNSRHHTLCQMDSSKSIDSFLGGLPFEMTDAQKKAIDEIISDLCRNVPMNRLLQGDVGSGKTAVAAAACYFTVQNGMQAALMAPTEILASQHLESFTEILEKYNIRCELLISSITKKKKEEILEKLKNGEIDVLIGTHAILEDNVIFKNLGLVVTDEQHRFGVKQRGTIASKGQNPDIVAMSATPIPRTLALILYGDLDISIIDELPPNRKKIETYAVRKNMEERVNNFIRKQIKEGRQAYIVCPLVEENEDMEGLQSVIELAERYQKETFSEYKVAYLHGKMKPKEKDEIMLKFKDGEIQILIATTVIEVGVNVPNASIMVVENAERFGLAQLHQLRGRVGRGEYQSYCILKYEGNGDTIKQRMKVMCDTNDGFVISEKDLELRGSGDFFGTEQHGLPEFKIANLFEDIGILKRVQGLAIKIMEDDPLLEKEKNEKLNEIVKEKFNSRIEL